MVICKFTYLAWLFVFRLVDNTIGTLSDNAHDLVFIHSFTHIS